MIKLIRIDDRLIHGQVAMVWSRSIGIDRILVVNDHAASNNTIKATLKMACPADLKCAVLTIQKGIETLNDPRAKDLRIFVVVNCPKDARMLVERVEGIKNVNVGNYGKTDKDSEKEKITNNVFLNENDKNDIREIAKQGTSIYYQLLPDNEKIDLTKI